MEILKKNTGLCKYYTESNVSVMLQNLIIWKVLLTKYVKQGDAGSW